MGYKTRINEAVKEATELNKEAFQKYLDSLPETVEEVKTMKIMSGADIVAECLAKGDTSGAAQHDSTKTYKRYYTTLRAMDHKANAMTAFRRKGQAGLKQYYNKVIRQAYYIKGKYPQFFKEDQGAPEVKPTLWEKLRDKFTFKVTFSAFALTLLMQCGPRHSHADDVYTEYIEGMRMQRIMINAKTLSSEIPAIIRKDSIRIYNMYR